MSELQALHKITSDQGPNTICPQNYNITAPYLSDNQLWARSQQRNCPMELFLGIVILTRDLNEFRTVISGDLGLWENKFLVP